MSIYGNETNKIYPDLNLTTPQEPQAYRLKKLTEIETYLLVEIEVRERLAKKMKRFNRSNYIDRYRPNYINSYYWIGFLLPHLQVVLACLLVLHQVELAYSFLLQQPLHENLLKYLQ